MLTGTGRRGSLRQSKTKGDKFLSVKQNCPNQEQGVRFNHSN